MLSIQELGKFAKVQLDVFEQARVDKPEPGCRKRGSGYWKDFTVNRELSTELLVDLKRINLYQLEKYIEKVG